MERNQEATLTQAATHCELDSEFYVRQTGQMYKADHFSARKLCSPEKYLENPNLCASEGIIGPISDVKQTSKNA